MQLSCDLGESYGAWQMGCDDDVMPHLDAANVACGFHAGDPLTLQRTLALAASHNVAVGAHPAYPDLVGFGRRSLSMSDDALIATVHYQLAALEGMAACVGLTLTHLKPHGALYHDMMNQPRVFNALLRAVTEYHRPLPLVVQATANNASLSAEANHHGVALRFEAFADRRYQSDGSLVPRSDARALLSADEILQQTQQLARDGCVTTIEGEVLALQADTLCIHGDNPQAVAQIATLQTLVNQAS